MIMLGQVGEEGEIAGVERGDGLMLGFIFDAFLMAGRWGGVYDSDFGRLRST